jgi:hypothetical protein
MDCQNPSEESAAAVILKCQFFHSPWVKRATRRPLGARMAGFAFDPCSPIAGMFFSAKTGASFQRAKPAAILNEGKQIVEVLKNLDYRR